ncbi:hypothetical protein EGW08_014891 [Elysia chlorotica]|uniref:Cyclic nucleotide-binding domain-containing protein n=1 Tax=Elysia chlorotica TaxID=188477 RepID=A0A433T6X7_ELYCH|nr:hypothetical protein EGW08_014891 [Elysia chlorotica]
MHELVRAFSSRTQRAKKKISQPPTPSSESDFDAHSAVSGDDQTTETRNIRSFLPSESRASDAMSHENPEHFVGVWHCKVKMPRWLKKLRFPTTIEPHSKIYVSWLFLVTLAFMYNAIVIPLRGVFPYQTEHNVHYWMCADYLCDAIYLMDIIFFKSRLRFINNGVVELDKKEVRKNYTRKLAFKLDLASLTPLDLFYFLEGVGVNVWLRLPRVLKVQSYWEFYERCDQASRSFGHAIRIIKTMTYMLFLIHIETCGYYAVSNYQGIKSNRWVYQGEGIAYIRCFYLATKTATSIGNNPKPTNNLEYSFMTLYWLSGVFVFALLIGQIRDIVEAAGLVKDNYRKKMDSCLWYMQSINLPEEMKDKVREWFLYNWEQQKTIDERSLVSSLPRKLQTDLAINVHFNTLSKVQLFQDCERNLLYDLVLKLKPILYLPGDYICQKGEVGKEMYIVTQGQVEVVGGENNQTVLATLHEGSVFGEISLLAMSGRGNRRTADVRCKGYTNVFTLSKHDFETAMTEYPEAQNLLKKRAKRLLKANARMEKKHKKVEAEEIIRTSPETPKMLQTVIQVMDPDSNLVKHLTPIIRRNQMIARRPHSRSHSHRLSPSASQMQHLSPHRSHSFRHSGTSSNVSSTNKLPSREMRESNIQSITAKDSVESGPSVPADRTSYCTDDETDEPVFDDTSDDVSLSEVLQDVGLNSSFEYDIDEDQIKERFHNEELAFMDYTKNDDSECVENVPSHGVFRSQDDDEEMSLKETYNTNFGPNKMFITEPVNSPPYPADLVEPKKREFNKVDKEITSEDSQDSGLPDAQRLESHKKELTTVGGGMGVAALPSYPEPPISESFRGSHSSHLKQPNRLSGTSIFSLFETPAHGPCDKVSDTDDCACRENIFESHTEPSHLNEGNIKKVIVQESPVDVFRGTSRIQSVPAVSTCSPSEADKSIVVDSNTRVQKLAPPSLVIVTSPSSGALSSVPTLNSSSTSMRVGSGRTRKLSVVTPPISPSSPEGFSQHIGRISVSPQIPATTSIMQLTSMISVNGSAQDGSSHPLSERFTPVETVPIYALPPIKASEGHAVETGVRAGAGPGGTDLLDTGLNCGSECGGSRPMVKILEPLISNGLESNRADSSKLVQSTVRGNQKHLDKTKAGREEECNYSNTIPNQNRITCAVEIHRQRSTTPAGRAKSPGSVQGGHKETML